MTLPPQSENSNSPTVPEPGLYVHPSAGPPPPMMQHSTPATYAQQLPPYVQAAPRKKGMPGWAWGIIGGGGFIAIAIIVVSVLIVNWLTGIVGAADAAAKGQPVALPTVTSTPGPTVDPFADPPPVAVATNGVYGLDIYAYFDATVSIEGHPGAGWTADPDDPEDKYSWVKGDACKFLLSQGPIVTFGPPSLDADDGVWTDESLSRFETMLLKSNPDATKSGEPFVLTMPVSDGNVIEFKALAYSYTSKNTGKPATVVMIHRTLTWNIVTYSFLLSCEASALSDKQATAQEILDGFTLTLS